MKDLPRQRQHNESSNTYWSKKDLVCPTCKSENIVLVFFKSKIISNIIKSVEQEKMELVSSDKGNKGVDWLCKNCYDVGEIVSK